MSHSGKMFRGEKWSRHLEVGKKLDQAKMQDVNYYLEHKPKIEEKVEEEKNTKKAKK